MEEPAAQFPPNHLLAPNALRVTGFPPNHLLAPKVLVLCGLGMNCEEETYAAYKLCGTRPRLVHVNEWFAGKVSLDDFQLVHFTGGFSFGDHLGAGKVLANRIRFKPTATGKPLIHELEEFLASGGFVFGVCNGFQTLTALGLLPGIEDGQSVSLAPNIDGNFQDRWVSCQIDPESPLSYLGAGETLSLPIRHGEGRLVVKNDAVETLMVSKKLMGIRYLHNPNGSAFNCAGLCNETGRVVGMMPHPEAFLSPFNHPEWSRKGSEAPRADGLFLLQNLVNYVSHNR
ncbi:MAG: phosphoribosylformylglycinamidine synthase subunit PurQ [Deltaproteobacteria bacterium]|nr:phosphoribosylformylglycinamidine synthase subunit PurQ [Deltaproteobacteria bacterium]